MSDIQLALNTNTSRLTAYNRFVSYYEGEHELVFATEKFKNTFGNMLKQMRENLCQIVVDAPTDRMEVINFSSGSADTETSAKAWQIWQDAQMELLANDVHKEAFKCGRAYLIVWEDAFGEPDFYVQDSRQCALIKDENTDLPLFGAKLWLADDKKARLNLYYADRVEKYATRKESNHTTDFWKEANFEPYSSETEEASMPNPFGVVPMFEFKAEPLLAAAIPIQDRLNKTICDELVAQEFSAFRQRYATGLELPTNDLTGAKELPFKAGADRLWFTDDANVKFGEFGASELEQFLKVEDAARLSVARVTGTPLHFFSFTTSDAMSGEALKTLESRFTKRVKRTCLAFGSIWAQAMRLALQIKGVYSEEALTVQWESPEQRSEAEMLGNLEMKKMTLEVPVDKLREEYGYTVEDINKFNTMNRGTDEETETQTRFGEDEEARV